MVVSEWSQDKEKREKESLARHARLSRLFNENRFAFEIERKRMIAEVIDSVEDEKQRDLLVSFQNSWDKKMKNAGSPHNRYVLATTFFWEHFNEKWHPALKKINKALSGDERD
jgi:hypothetical protein